MKDRNTKKAGYKNSKVGWIPDEWECCRLGECLTLQRGFDLPSASRKNGKFPIVSSGGVTGFHSISKVKGPGIVTGRYGSIGGVFLLQCDFWPLNTTLFVSEFRKTNPDFAYLILLSVDFGKYSAKTGVPGINRNEIHQIRISLPPMPEQRRIAETLLAWDRAITLTSRLIDAKQRLKKGLMQQLLHGRMRFSEFGKPVREKGELPKGWKRGKMGDLVQINKEVLSESTKPDYQFTYIDLSCVDNGHVAYPSETTRFSLAPSRARRVAKNGDVLMSTVRPHLLGYARVERDKDIVCSTGFAVLTEKRASGADFAYQSLFSEGIQNQLLGLITGSNYPAVNASDVRHLCLIYPEAHERGRIAASLFACDHEMKCLSRKRELLMEQKTGLMQKLLTGQLRITTRNRGR